MNLGLLGAIGGLGKGLENFGADLVRRREQALEWARREAQYQRERADRSTERQLDREFQASQQTERERAADERQAQSQSFQREERKESEKFRSSERVAGEKFQSTEKSKDRSAQRDLAELRASLEHSNNQAEIRLRDQLSADDVHSVQYGEPDANGYAKVYLVTKAGEVKDTGKKVYRPKTEDDAGTTL